jgi:hypothetical protein
MKHLSLYFFSHDPRLESRLLRLLTVASSHTTPDPGFFVLRHLAQALPYVWAVTVTETFLCIVSISSERLLESNTTLCLCDCS